MVVTHHGMTAEDLARLPADGGRYELVDGELHTMSPTGYEHGVLTMAVALSLASHVRAHRLGVVCAAETGFKVKADPDTVRGADVAFVRQEAVEAHPHVEGYWPGAPDLVVEVISPNDLYTEVEKKIAEWLAAGARMVIVINPRQRSVRIHRSLTEARTLSLDDQIDGEDVVPGWTLAVREIFTI